MAFNGMNNKCEGCRHKGLHMCLNSNKCEGNSEYVAGKIGDHSATKKSTKK